MGNGGGAGNGEWSREWGMGNMGMEEGAGNEEWSREWGMEGG